MFADSGFAEFEKFNKFDNTALIELYYKFVTTDEKS